MPGTPDSFTAQQIVIGTTASAGKIGTTDEDRTANYYELIKAEALTDCMFGTELDVCDGLHHKPQSVQLIAKAMLHGWNMEEK